mgnify:CR=1 FL=1
MHPNSKTDQVWIGLSLSFLLNLLVFAIFYWNQWHRFGKFSAYFSFVLENDLLPKILSLSIAPNLGLFFLGIWREMLFFSRGVLMATAIGGVLVFIVYFI